MNRALSRSQQFVKDQKDASAVHCLRFSDVAMNVIAHPSAGDFLMDCWNSIDAPNHIATGSVFKYFASNGTDYLMLSTVDRENAVLS